MTRRTSVLAALAAAALAAPAPALAGEWLAGDTHVHSTYSHDSYGGPGDDNTGLDEVYTLGFTVRGIFSMANARGLDFVTVSDHNDVRSQSDPGWGAHGVIGLPGYENSLAGHALMLGARTVYPKPEDSRSAADVKATQADPLRADGGVFQINHPADSGTPDPDDLDWKLGYEIQPDVVEAWNGSYLVQPPIPSANSHDDAIKYWQGWLDRGARVGLTGGSDTHWITTSLVQGAGQPTTWVYASSRSAAGILDGLKRGRTFVSHQPPNYGGPRIYLEADADRNGTYERIVGDEAPPGSPARVRVVGGFGKKLQLFTDGGAKLGAAKTILSGNFEHRFTLPAGRTWVRADLFQEDLRDARGNLCVVPLLWSYCRNRILVFGMTSALYIR